MDLKQNIIDSVKECEIKLGYREEEITLYYPESVLAELLGVKKCDLKNAIADFCASGEEELCGISIVETKEQGRYQINVPKKTVAFVHKQIPTSLFVEEFVQNIHKPGMTKESVVKLFKRYAEAVAVEQVAEQEWAIYFSDASVDAYVYYIEEDIFGLQYHRFTRESYQHLLGAESHV